jgi:SAM-dependent methyltransferase
MCHEACLDFARRALTYEDVHERHILDVGSRDVNGSVRSVISHMEPSGYWGVDIEEGPGVDELCAAENLAEYYGEQTFDVVICTELLEHVVDWRAIVVELKDVLRIGGVLLVTTRSPGFEWHPYPLDTWRYTLDNMRAIFADMRIELLEDDPSMPGVFMKAYKLTHDTLDLSAITLPLVPVPDWVHLDPDQDAAYDEIGRIEAAAIS